MHPSGFNLEVAKALFGSRCKKLWLKLYRCFGVLIIDLEDSKLRPGVEALSLGVCLFLRLWGFWTV